MEFEVCVGNYGYYSEGELRDRWVTLPMRDEDLAAWLKASGLRDPMHEEVYVSDYDAPLGIERFGECASLDSLNMLAKVMDREGEGAVERVEAALDCGIDAPGTVSGLANLILQADEIPFYEYYFDGIGNCRNMGAEEKLGYTVAEETGLIDKLSEIGAEYYFDFERYGADLTINEYTIGEDGYLDRCADMPAEDCYDLEELRGIAAEWDADHAAARAA